jgi:hypothetical protein
VNLEEAGFSEIPQLLHHRRDVAPHFRAKVSIEGAHVCQVRVSQPFQFFVGRQLLVEDRAFGSTIGSRVRPRGSISVAGYRARGHAHRVRSIPDVG